MTHFAMEGWAGARDLERLGAAHARVAISHGLVLGDPVAQHVRSTGLQGLTVGAYIPPDALQRAPEEDRPIKVLMTRTIK